MSNKVHSNKIRIRLPILKVMYWEPGPRVYGTLNGKPSSTPFGGWKYQKELIDWCGEHNIQLFTQISSNHDYIDVFFPDDREDTALLFKLRWGGE